MTAVTEREKWMSVLAQSQFGDLQHHWQALQLEVDYQLVRQPEIGLTQIRARMGGTGRQFNMGDATITRAVVKLASGELGYSYIRGRNKAHAELAAVLDGLLQTKPSQALLISKVIEPLAAIKQEQEQLRAAEVAATKVDFFTLVRGED
ncbi:phosphonate C-P lyase system protein PhnG [Vibrio methylphosphonaticus]|uniref:phosphonate C-P lyase system protein PhnG n=1 Tax=Vibrio methylphosphonaticus TaxID=2946866 RepID=UPI00202AA543|nr:phosphonate C-P lyase system protein PhnG [Vibrio methylphosphonaticus]MCL9775250.1 phosphonate C-P lyase system protein PhnG [Vibrio methylphosphonaticus]